MTNMNLADYIVTSPAIELFNKLGPAAQAAGMEVGTADEMFATFPNGTYLDRVILTVFNDPNNDYSRVKTMDPKKLFTQWFYTRYEYYDKRLSTPAILNCLITPKQWIHNKIFLVDSLEIAAGLYNKWGDYEYLVGYGIIRQEDLLPPLHPKRLAAQEVESDPGR